MIIRGPTVVVGHPTRFCCFAVDKIVNALDCGSVVCAAFLDLRKAFDSLDHVTLLHRIQELGVYNVELRWFQNYLSDRYQRVK